MGLIDYIFPSEYKCIFCDREVSGSMICDYCYTHLPFHRGKVCEKCGGEIYDDGDLCIDCKNAGHVFDKNFSILKYENNVQSKIVEFKQTGKKYIGDAFAELMKEYFEKMKIPFDMIIPVPIHENRRRERGFNQSEILVKDIAEYYGRVYPDILTRVKDTPHQTGLSREHRMNNLDDAFKVTDKKRVKNKIILLVDDIYTTGSTIDECAITLKRAGAKKVYGLCLSRPEVNKKEN